MMKSSWEAIKKMYEEKFGIPPQIVDLMGVQEILNLSVEGLSNVSIADRLDLEKEYINSILKEFMKFEGWQSDLDFSPKYVYKNHGIYYDYVSHINTISPITSAKVINTSYNLCRLYEKLIKEIEKYNQ